LVRPPDLVPFATGGNATRGSFRLIGGWFGPVISFKPPGPGFVSVYAILEGLAVGHLGNVRKPFSGTSSTPSV
jgi:hypothetical protein